MWSIAFEKKTRYRRVPQKVQNDEWCRIREIWKTASIKRRATDQRHNEKFHVMSVNDWGKYMFVSEENIILHTPRLSLLCCWCSCARARIWLQLKKIRILFKAITRAVSTVKFHRKKNKNHDDNEQYEGRGIKREWEDELAARIDYHMHTNYGETNFPNFSFIQNTCTCIPSFFRRKSSACRNPFLGCNKKQKPFWLFVPFHKIINF